MLSENLARARSWLPVLLEYHRGDENVSWHWVQTEEELTALLAGGPRAEPGERPYTATIYHFVPVYSGLLEDELFQKAIKWAAQVFAGDGYPFVVETESRWGYSPTGMADLRETLDLFRGRHVVVGLEPDLSGKDVAGSFSVRLP